MKVQHLSQFNFGSAVYHLCDDHGTPFQLHINYLANSFEIIIAARSPLLAATHEAASIAQDLLNRKRHKNFAEPA